MHIDREKLRESNPEIVQEEANVKEAEQSPSASVLPEAPVKKEKKRKTKAGRPAYVLLAVCLVILLAAAAYKVYADQSLKPAKATSDLNTEGLLVDNTDNMLVVQNPGFAHHGEKAGLILYPASQVEAECYLPLMIQLSRLGYDCFLPKAFGNQPILNVVGAASVTRKYSGIHHWYLVGHAASCGPAAHYANGHPDEIEGLILLNVKGAVSSSCPVLYLNASSDSEAAPSGVSSVQIVGGNSTGYLDADGLLSGDEPALLSPKAQIAQAGLLMHEFLLSSLQEVQ